MKKLISPLLLTLSVLSLTIQACQAPDISIKVESAQSDTASPSNQNTETENQGDVETAPPKQQASSLKNSISQSKF